MSARRISARRLWAVAALCLAFLGGTVLAAEEHELVSVELAPAEPYDGPESLAHLIRYSEPFAVEGGIRVEVIAREADVHVALVDSSDGVREAQAWVRERERLSFGRVPHDEYRLRITASSGSAVRARALTGGFSPVLLAIAVLALLSPPLFWTLRRNLR